MMPPDDKAELLAQIAASRARLAAAAGGLRDAGEGVKRSLDVPARVSDSFRKHRPAWLGGAALLGILLSKLPARKKTVYVDRDNGELLGKAAKAGFAWGAVKTIAGLARPLLSEIALTRFTDWAARQAQKRNGGSGGNDTVV
jgi:hypothetical protein